MGHLDSGRPRGPRAGEEWPNINESSKLANAETRGRTLPVLEDRVLLAKMQFDRGDMKGRQGAIDGANRLRDLSQRKLLRIARSER